jgi:hypothetical protein
MELRGTLITPEQRTEFQANITPEQTAMLTRAERCDPRWSSGRQSVH